MQIPFGSTVISYEELLERFWRIDPTDAGGQFYDKGPSYRTAVFYHSEEQRQKAEASKRALKQSGRFGDKPIVTEIAPVGLFYPVKEYHQHYYRKSPVRYKAYLQASGREAFLRRYWGEDPFPGRSGNSMAATNGLNMRVF